MSKFVKQDIWLVLDEAIEISNELVPRRVNGRASADWPRRDGGSKEERADEDVVESGVVDGSPQWILPAVVVNVVERVLDLEFHNVRSGDTDELRACWSTVRLASQSCTVRDIRQHSRYKGAVLRVLEESCEWCTSRVDVGVLNRRSEGFSKGSHGCLYLWCLTAA